MGTRDITLTVCFRKQLRERVSLGKTMDGNCDTITLANVCVQKGVFPLPTQCSWDKLLIHCYLDQKKVVIEDE